MTLPHIFTFDNQFDFDISELDNYEWNRVPDERLNWPSSKLYNKDTETWNPITPNMCKEAYKISLELFKKINPNSEVKRLYRCLLHRYAIDVPMDRNYIHRDEHLPNFWSTTFYVQGDGPTEFFTARDESTLCQTIEFQKGRAAVFPSGYWHRPSVTHTMDRYVIAFVFEVYNLVPEMNDVVQKCTCGKSPDIYCTGMHKRI